jgi:WD40 repeat protein
MRIIIAKSAAAPPRPSRGLARARQVHALAFIPARGWLASGGSDGSVRLWRADASGGLTDGGGGGATGI